MDGYFRSPGMRYSPGKQQAPRQQIAGLGLAVFAAFSVVGWLIALPAPAQNCNIFTGGNPCNAGCPDECSIIICPQNRCRTACHPHPQCDITCGGNACGSGCPDECSAVICPSNALCKSSCGGSGCNVGCSPGPCGSNCPDECSPIVCPQNPCSHHQCSECGGHTEPGCCVIDGCGFVGCEAGLLEISGCSGSDCLCSSSRCYDPAPCGGDGERACCVGEGAPCDAGFAQFTPCDDLEDCLCSEVAGVAVLADGICLDPMCGGEGERGCCLLGEDRPAEGISSACHDGLIETGSCIVDCQCSGPATLGVNSDGICVDPQCGGEGERACCLNEQVELGVANCEPGLIELVGYADEGGDGACLGLVTVGSSSGTCHRFTPCGGEGQRACCAAERPGQPCDPGLTEVPGCSGDCFCGGSLTGVVDDDILGISSGTCVRFEEIGEPGVGYTAPAPSQDCSQRGYADLHMHLFADIAHGGGVLAGEPCPPGSSSYCDETLTLDVNDALSDCYGTDRDLVSKEGDDLHNPENGILPPLCPGFIPDCGSNLFHGDHTLFDDAVGSDLGTFDGSQSNLGVPAFNGWPQWTSTTHQQVYYKWLERAWRGGLRLIVQMAVNNTALCETNKRFRNADCSDSMAFIDEQLQAAYDFQDYIDALAGGPGLGWFRIVLTPAEARSAIAQGKMAVVLAIEVDHLFNCKFPAAECVVVDNQLVSCSFTLDNDVCGDPDDPSKSSEQWVREQVDYYYDVWGVRHMFPIHNFDNSFGGAATWQSAIEVGNRFIEGHWYTTQDECSDEGYAFKLGEDGAVIQFIAGLFGFGQGVEVPIRDEEASCNFWGLFPLGEVLVQKMMDRGMIIDIDHMSNRSLDDTIALAQGFRAEGYPLMASHALFFDLNTPDIRHERMRTPAQLAALNAMGSMVGVMLKDDVLDRDTRGERKTLDYAGSGVNDDCRHSSKTFAQAYKYAVDHMGGRVAMGSDFNGVAGHFGPRFGSDACGGDNFERSKQLKADDRLDYPFVLDQFGTFSKQVSGQKAFDYNVDGLAHVGLLPDFVADLNNVGLSGTDLDPLFQSAEAYIQMWELARGETVRTGCLACSGDIFTGDSDGDGVCNDIDVCPGGNDLVDVNNDGVANLLDFGEIAREFGCLSGCIADINGDGATNLIELQLLATDWLCGTGL